MTNPAGTLITNGISNSISAAEVADIALANANAGIPWTADGCAAFVWGITNLAGLPFFDPHSIATDYTYLGNPRLPQDAGYAVPHLNPNSGSGTPDISGDGWTAAWTGSNFATLKSQLQKGDVVRIYKYGDVTETSGPPLSPQAHSFVVISVSGADVQVVDNWGGPQIAQHSFDDFSSGTWVVGGNLQSAIVSRINTQFAGANVPQDLKGWGLGDWSGLSGPSVPDLVINNLTLTNATVTSGTGISVSASVLNNGSGAAGAFSTHLYLSTDGAIDQSVDTVLATSSTMSLAAGATSYVFNQSIPIPSGLTPGTYYVGIWTDYNDQVIESNNANNSFAVQITVSAPQKPDFDIYYDPTLSTSSVVRGGDVQFSYYVTTGEGIRAPRPRVSICRPIAQSRPRTRF